MAKYEEELREDSPEEYRRMQAGRQEQPMNSQQAGDYYELPRFLHSPQRPRTVLSMAVVLVSLLIGFGGGPGINGAPGQPSGSDTQTNTDSI